MTFGSTFGRTFSPTFQPHSLKKGGGWWDLNGTITSCVGAWQPKGAANYTDSLTDLSGSGNDAYAGNAPDWDVTNGWKCDTANKVLHTGITISDGYSVIARFSNVGTSKIDSCICGYLNTNQRFYLLPLRNSGSQNQHGYGYGNSLFADGIVANILSDGIMAMTKTGCYYNGTEEINWSKTFSGSSATDFTLLARHDNTVIAAYFLGYLQAIAVYSANIETYIPNLTTAMAAL